MPLGVVSRAVQSSKRAFQFLNLALVINLLPFGQFQSFQHVFHFIERAFQFLDDFVDLLDGLGDGGKFRAALAFRLRFRRWPGLRWNGLAFDWLNGRVRFGGFDLFKILSGRFTVLNRTGLCAGNLGRLERLQFGWTGLAPAGMAAATASRAALRAFGRRRCRLFGSRFRLFIRNHVDKLPG
jgi:hypothetical protein